MIWAVFVLAILVVAEGLYILLRDPKRGGSIGINGVSSHRKVSEAEDAPVLEPASEPESIETGAAPSTSAEKPVERQPAAEQQVVAKQDEEVAKAQPESPRTPAEKDNSPANGGDDWDAAPPAVVDAESLEAPAEADTATDKDDPEPGTPVAAATGVAAGATGAAAAASSADDDWDAPPPALDDNAPIAAESRPEPSAKAEVQPEAPAASSGDDWDAPPPALDDAPVAKAPEPTPEKAAEEVRGADNVSEPPTPDAKNEPAPPSTPAAEAPAAGGDDWATPPPALDDAPAAKAPEPEPAAMASEPKPELSTPPAKSHSTKAPTTRGGDDWASPPLPLDYSSDNKAPEAGPESARKPETVLAPEPDAAEQREDSDDDQAAARAQEHDAQGEDDGAHDDGPLGPGSAEPGADGSGPAGWVKGDDNTMSFHSSDSPGFDDAEASVWFKDEATARSAGFRHWDPSKR